MIPIRFRVVVPGFAAKTRRLDADVAIATGIRGSANAAPSSMYAVWRGSATKADPPGPHPFQSHCPRLYRARASGGFYDAPFREGRTLWTWVCACGLSVELSLCTRNGNQTISFYCQNHDTRRAGNTTQIETRVAVTQPNVITHSSLGCLSATPLPQYLSVTLSGYISNRGGSGSHRGRRLYGRPAV